MAEAGSQRRNYGDAEEYLMEQSDVDLSQIPPIQRVTKHNNTLPIWNNRETMNLNHLVLENILNSAYYKNHLSTFTTFYEVVDEIYYKVEHLEPWEKGTRKTTGQTGMCGGVRGVGAGGVVSSAFCNLYKFFMMKLTRRQLVRLINHADSPYIRGIGFIYVRFCQPPDTFWEWYEPYFDDEEEIDPKAGGGELMTVGQMAKLFLTKLDWYGTLFPRIPVPVQKDIDNKLREHNRRKLDEMQSKPREDAEINREENRRRSPVRNNDRGSKKDPCSISKRRSRSPSKSSRRRSRSRSPNRSKKSRSGRSKSPSTSSKHHHHHSRSRSRDQKGRDNDEKSGSRRQSTSRDEDDKRKHKKHKKHRHHHRHRHHKHKSSKDEKRSRSSSRSSPDEKSKNNDTTKKPDDMKEEGELME